MSEFDTPLSPQEENDFQQWKQKYAPQDSGEDYDLRGAFKEGLTPDPVSGHWPDTYKKPNHPTFSVESKYAKDRPDLAGSWQGNTYVPPAKQASDLSPGQQWLQSLEDDGYSDADIAALRESRYKTISDAGYTVQEQDEYWGIKPDVNPLLKSVAKDGNERSWRYADVPAPPVSGVIDSFARGLGNSPVALEYFEYIGKPEKRMPESPGLVNSIAAGVGTTLGSLPAYATGFLGSVWATKNPIAGAALTGYSGGLVASAISYAAIDAMETGKPMSSNAIYDAFTNHGGDIQKEAVISAAANVAGLGVGKLPFVPKTAASQAVAQGVGQVAGATTMAAAIEQRIPKAEDFVAGVVIAATLGGAAKITEPIARLIGPRERIALEPAGKFVDTNLKKTWADTGIPPKVLGDAASKDPIIQQSVLARDSDNQPVTTGMDHLIQAEPVPVETPKVAGAPKVENPVEPVMKSLEPVVDAADVALTGDAAEAVSAFVGLQPNARTSGPGYGIMNAFKLEKAVKENSPVAQEIETTFSPIREQLRKEVGDAVTLYRVQEPVKKEKGVTSGSSPEGTREVLSWTSDRKFAESYAGTQKLPYKTYSEAEIVQKEKVLEDTGSVKLDRGYELRTEDDPTYGKSIVIYQNGEHITDTDSVRAFIEGNHGYNAEVAGENAIKQQKIVSAKVKLDDVVWITNRANQREFIVRNKQDSSQFIDETGTFKPLTITAEPSPTTGIAPVERVSPDQLAALADMNAPVSPAEQAALEAGAKKWINADGSVDLEAVLIEHFDGEGVAQIFRASGRDYAQLPPKTLRALKLIGNEVEDAGGYEKKPVEGVGGGKPPAEPPAGGKPTSEPTGVPLTLEEASARIKAGRDTTVYGKTWKDSVRRLEANWSREFAILTAFDNAHGLSKNETGRSIEQMTRLTLSFGNRASHVIGRNGYRVATDKFGNLKYEDAPEIPALASVWETAAQSKITTVDHTIDYLQSLDTLDREALKLDTTTSPDDARAFIAALSKTERAELEKIADIHRKVFNASLDNMEAIGIISAEGKDKIQEAHPNWFNQTVAKAPAKGTKGKAIGRAKGHTYKLGDQITEEGRILVRREKVMSINIQRAHTVSLLKGLDLVEEPKMVKKGGGVEAVENAVIEGMPNEPLAGESEYFKYDPHHITYLEDGNTMSVAVKDFPHRDLFMESLMSPSKMERDNAIGVLSKLTKIPRTGIVAMPVFISKMSLWDSVQVVLHGVRGRKGIPYLNTFPNVYKAMDHVLEGALGGKGHREFVSAFLHGGTSGALETVGASNLATTMHKLENIGHFRRYGNTFMRPIDLIRDTARLADSVHRVGTTYSKNVKHMGEVGAANEAQLVGGDYREATMSSFVNNLHSITMFMRAFQRAGVDSMVRAWRRDPAGVITSGLLTITMPVIGAVALAMKFSDDHQDELPVSMRWENQDNNWKDTHIPFYVPGWLSPSGKPFLTGLPILSGYGTLFGGWVHRMVSKEKDSNPRAFDGYVSHIAQGFATQSVPGVANPFIQPLLEVAANHEFYTGREITPYYLTKASGNNVYRPWTTESAKRIAKLINAAGGDIGGTTVEFLVKKWTGGLGDSILRNTDKLIGTNVLPTDISNTPFFGSFVARNPGMSAQPLTDFYNEYEKYQTAASDVNVLKKQEGSDAALEEVQNSEAFGYNLSIAAKALSEMRKSYYAIYSSSYEGEKGPDGKPITNDQIADDKARLLDEISGDMITLARETLKDLDEYRVEYRENADGEPQ